MASLFLMEPAAILMINKRKKKKKMKMKINEINNKVFIGLFSWGLVLLAYIPKAC